MSLELVPADYVTENERGIQQLLDAHPAVKAYLTLLINGMRDDIRACLDGADPADTIRSLAKDENTMRRIGISLLETASDWMTTRNECHGN